MAPPTTSDPCTIVIFGGSGDLSKRKLLPALDELHCESRIAPETAIVGYARTGESDDTYRKEMHDAVAEFARQKPIDEAKWAEFASRLHFFRGDLYQEKNVEGLKTRLAEVEKERKLPGNRLYYLAIPPSAIGGVVKNLGEAGLVYPVDAGPWSRGIVEKPFGRDPETARKLKDELSPGFRARQSF